MAVLPAAARRALPTSAFAGPARSFPIPDRAHAIKALQMRKFAPNPSAIVAKVRAKFPDVGHASRSALLSGMKG